MSRRTPTWIGRAFSGLAKFANVYLPSWPSRPNIPTPSFNNQTVAGVSSVRVNRPGFTCPGAITYGVYREMMLCPTLVIARSVAIAPMIAAKWNIEGDDQAAKDVLEKNRPALEAAARHCPAAMDYGFAAAEVVWDNGKKNIAGIKPFLPENCAAEIDANGLVRAYNGWKLAEMGALLSADKFTAQLAKAGYEPTAQLVMPDVKRDEGKPGTAENPLPQERFDRGHFLWHTYGGDGVWPYGKSCLENAFKPWVRWNETLEQMGNYAAKTSGINIVIRYPMGTVLGPDSQPMNSQVLATMVADKLPGVVCLPSVVSPELVEAAIGMAPGQVANLGMWDIKLIEPSGDHAPGFAVMLGEWDKMLCRSYGVPERSVLEGTHGTKAEAEAHASIVTVSADAELMSQQRTIHQQIVIPLLRANGCDVAGARFVPVSIGDSNEAMRRLALRTGLEQPVQNDATSNIDFPKLFGDAGIPLIEDAAGLPDGVDLDPAADLTDAMAVQRAADAGAITPGGEAVADTALNGAQVTSMLDILERIAGGTLRPDAARAALAAAFPTVDPSLINTMVNEQAKLEPADAAATPAADPAASRTRTGTDPVDLAGDSPVRQPDAA